MTLYVAIGVAVVCVLWTLFHIPKKDDLGDDATHRAKLRESIVLDIRANNQYCGVYLALIGVIAAIVAGNQTSFAAVLKAEHLWPFGLSVLAGALSILFIPAGYGDKAIGKMQIIWLRSVICEQIVVVFTCYGIWNAFTVLT